MAGQSGSKISHEFTGYIVKSTVTRWDQAQLRFFLLSGRTSFLGDLHARELKSGPTCVLKY